MFLIAPASLIIQFTGINKTTGIIASITIAFTPLITNILGSLFNNEIITTKEKIGTIIAFIGILIFILIQNNSIISLKISKNLLGIFLILIAAVVRISGLFMYQKLKEKKQDLITLNSFFLSTLVFILILLFKDYNLIIPNIPHLNTTLSVLYMAILGSLIGFIAIQKANKYVEVSEANIFIYLKPLFGIPLSILLLNEKFSQLMILPIILIGFGIYLNVIEKFESKTPNTKTT